MSEALNARRGWFVLGAVLAAVSVAGGAFGAHALRGRLDAHALDQWTTAMRYLMYAGLGGVLSGLVGRRGGAASRWAAALLAIGGLIFAAAVGGLALGGPRLLGAVAPLGGLSMIAGFLALAVAIHATRNEQ